MRLLIKQRVFSWTDSYDVYDQQGEARYDVSAELFAFGHQIHVYDKVTGEELGSVHQRLFSLRPTFEVVINGQTMGTVRKKFSLFGSQYEVDFRGWNVEGDFMNWDYSVYRGDREVMTITKELFHWGDTYVLDFQNPADEMPGLLLAIAIDAANCDH